MENTAVAYLRVSSRHQAESGLGLEAQAMAIREWAESTGTTILTTCVDAGVSGSTPAAKRKGFRRAVSDLREHKANALVVARRCRLSRGDSLTTAMLEHEVERAGGRVLSVDGIGNDSDAAGVLLKRVVDAVHEHFRNAIGESTKAALRAKRERGEYCGGRAPYGWQYSKGGLVPNKAEQAAITDAKRLRAWGVSLRAIGRDLSTNGHKPRNARQWWPKLVKALLSAKQSEV